MTGSITNSSPAAEPVDLGHLRRYTLGDKALEGEILGLYSSEIPKRIEALKVAQTDKEWKMAAHTLKGSSRAVGAWQVARFAEEAERLCGIGDQGACRIAIEMTEQAALEVCAFIVDLSEEAHAPQSRRSA